MNLQHVEAQCFGRKYTAFSVVFELSRAELYRNDLRENKNLFFFNYFDFSVMLKMSKQTKALWLLVLLNLV